MFYYGVRATQMDIICPECMSALRFNEDFCGSKGTVFRCLRCGIFFKIFNRNKPDAIEPQEWLIRKSNGTILKVEFLSSLQKWIFDGTAIKEDELLSGSGGWVKLGDVPELNGLFQLALLGRDERTSKLWKVPTLNLEAAGTPGEQVEKKGPAAAPPKPPPPKAPATDHPDEEITIQVPPMELEEKIRLAAVSEIPPPPEEDDEISDEARIITTPVDLTPKAAHGRPGAAMQPEKTSELSDLVVDVSGEAPVGEEVSPEALALEEHSIEVPIDGSSDEGVEAEQVQDLRPGGKRAVAIIAVCLTVGIPLAVVGYLFREPLAQRAAQLFKPGMSGGLEGHAPETQKETGEPQEQHEQWALTPALPADAFLADEVTGQEGAAPESEGGHGGEPRDFDIYYKKAIALQKAHNCSKAIEYFRKAITMNAKDTETWTGLAECYMTLGQRGNAIDAFKTALSFNSRYEPALFGIADAYKKQGNLDLAAERYSKYLDMYPLGPHANNVKKNLEEIKASTSKQPKLQGEIPENPYE
jgi:hypothetical protein